MSSLMVHVRRSMPRTVRIDAAVRAAVRGGTCPPDLGGTATTEDVTEAVVARLGAA
jgi:isocitrate/isopropylmalate dehydrogenase